MNPDPVYALNLEPDSGAKLNLNPPGRVGGLALRELEEIPDGSLSLSSPSAGLDDRSELWVLEMGLS